MTRGAKNVFARLSDEAKKSLDPVLSRLIIITDNATSACKAPLPDLEKFKGADELVQAFVKARLFTADERAGVRYVMLAHEALLRDWDQIVEWIKTNRKNLEKRERLQHWRANWETDARSDKYLLVQGPLEEARELLRHHDYFLKDNEVEFVQLSLTQDFAQRLRSGDKLDDSSSDLRANFPELWEKTIRLALKQSDERDRHHAAQLLGVVHEEKLIPELIALLLEDGSTLVRDSAATSLVQLNSETSFAELMERCKTENRSNGIRALAFVRTAADFVDKPTAFEACFNALKPDIRAKVIRNSQIQRFLQGWPTLIFTVIPSIVLSSLFAGIFKTVPGYCNWALCQPSAGWFKGSFTAVLACFFWGGIITFFIAFHRVVFRSELGTKSFLQPWTGLLAGALGGALSSLLILLLMVYVCDDSVRIGLGWTTMEARDVLWTDILIQNRDFWPYMIMGTGLGLGMALTCNGLWASPEWSKLLGSQSPLTGKNVISQVFRLIGFIRRFSLPIPACMLVASILAFGVVRTAPRVDVTPIITWSDALWGGMEGHTTAKDDTKDIIRWKKSDWGQGLGIAFDSATQAFGSYFCVVGMGLGIIAIRHGVRFDPRKN